MGIEIERKFLVNGEFRHQSTKNVSIRQAYLSVEKGRTVRLRILGNEAYITIKGSSEIESFSRGEWEYRIPVKDAEELINICLPGRINKTRYYIPAGKHTFEVDVFHDKNEGLIIAEIELESEDEKFEIPEWLGSEVTGNPAYYNANLIK